MDRTELLDVTRRVLDCIESDTLETAGGIRREPSAAFTDTGRFEADRAMLDRSPHVVGWSGEIKEPGDFTTKDVNGTPVLLVRGDDGRARAFVNACTHRGGQVAEGCGRAQRFTCAYHAWSYRSDGSLAGIPSREMFEGVDPDVLGLRSLPINERCGLLTVGLHADVDVDAALDGVSEHLTGFDYSLYEHIETRSFEVATNWKLAVDINFEGYHFAYLHRNTLHPFLVNNSVFDTFGRHCRWVFPLRATADLRLKPEDEWPDRFDGGVVYGIFPSCVLLESQVSATMLRVYPGDTPGTCVVHVSEASLTPIVDEAVRAQRVFALDITCTVLADEDFPAAEQCQRGAEHALDHVIIGRNEPLVQHFHQQWAEAVGIAEPATDPVDGAGSMAESATVDA
jgi:phenylpropionate dioxygenase-like ring-hydroxylating dioxygenase large terminal subunit